MAELFYGKSNEHLRLTAACFGLHEDIIETRTGRLAESLLISMMHGKSWEDVNVNMIVETACSIAKQMHRDMKSTGLALEVPSYKEVEKMANEQAKEGG